MQSKIKTQEQIRQARTLEADPMAVFLSKATEEEKKELFAGTGVTDLTLIVGSGGREHSIVWKLSQSPKVSQIFAIPGNGGMYDLAECYPDIPYEKNFSKKSQVSRDVAPLQREILNLLQPRLKPPDFCFKHFNCRSRSHHLLPYLRNTSSNNCDRSTSFQCSRRSNIRAPG